MGKPRSLPLLHIPITLAPPEGDPPIPAETAAAAVVFAKDLPQAKAALASIVFLNRVVLNHYRKVPPSDPDEGTRT